MSWLQILHFAGAILFISGLLLFVDATISQTVLEVRLVPEIYHYYADSLQQQQLIGGLYTAIGGGLARLQRDYQA